jgi:hypothetical protein
MLSSPGPLVAAFGSAHAGILVDLDDLPHLALHGLAQFAHLVGGSHATS